MAVQTADIPSNNTAKDVVAHHSIRRQPRSLISVLQQAAIEGSVNGPSSRSHLTFNGSTSSASFAM